MILLTLYVFVSAANLPDVLKFGASSLSLAASSDWRPDLSQVTKYCVSKHYLTWLYFCASCKALASSLS